MNSKGRRVLMVVAGGYLAYTGFGLARDVLKSSEENKVLFLVFAALFLIIGMVAVIMNIKGMLREKQEEADCISGEQESIKDKNLTETVSLEAPSEKKAEETEGKEMAGQTEAGQKESIKEEQP